MSDMEAGSGDVAPLPNATERTATEMALGSRVSIIDNVERPSSAATERDIAAVRANAGASEVASNLMPVLGVPLNQVSSTDQAAIDSFLERAAPVPGFVSARTLPRDRGPFASGIAAYDQSTPYTEQVPIEGSDPGNIPAPPGSNHRQSTERATSVANSTSLRGTTSDTVLPLTSASTTSLTSSLTASLTPWLLSALTPAIASADSISASSTTSDRAAETSPICPALPDPRPSCSIPGSAALASSTSTVSTSTASTSTDTISRTPDTDMSRVKRKRVTECRICGEETSTHTRFPSRKITSTCKHPGETCKTCLKSWISSQLDSVAWDHVTCAECDQIMQYEDVKFHASSKVFRRYDNASLRAYLSTDSTFLSCPAAKCKSGQLHPQGDAEPIFRCNACDVRSCIICLTPWHEGRTCTQYQQDIIDAKNAGAAAARRAREKRREEAASEVEVKRVAKVCPNKACGARIEKISGCNHMTCRQCRHQFCWLCLADYKDILQRGNMAHADGCTHQM